MLRISSWNSFVFVHFWWKKIQCAFTWTKCKSAVSSHLFRLCIFIREKRPKKINLNYQKSFFVRYMYENVEQVHWHSTIHSFTKISNLKHIGSVKLEYHHFNVDENHLINTQRSQIDILHGTRAIGFSWIRTNERTEHWSWVYRHWMRIMLVFSQQQRCKVTNVLKMNRIVNVIMNRTQIAQKLISFHLYSV